MSDPTNPYSTSAGQEPKLGPEDMTRDEFEVLNELVVNAIIEGEDLEEVAQDLVNAGWSEEDATQYIQSIQFQLMAQAEQQQTGSPGMGEGAGTLIWIGGLILINVLSQVFGWGFVIW